MNESEDQADGDGREAFGSALVGRAENDNQEERGADDFDGEARGEGIAAGGVCGVAVGGETAGDPTRFAAGDSVERTRGEDAAEHLGNDVGRKFFDRESFGDDQADRDRRVDVAPGDVADGESHGEQGESEGQRDPGEADAEPGISSRQYRGAAASEDQPEGAEQFSDGAFV